MSEICRCGFAVMPRCMREPIACFLPGGLKPHEWLCPEHAAKRGYCRYCGELSGGFESFEFVHPGTCANCQDQMDAEERHLVNDHAEDEDDGDIWYDADEGAVYFPLREGVP